MKKLYSILAIAVLFLLNSCNSEVEIDSQADRIRMILKTDSAELVTKATEEGEDKFNENKILTIHYYFFDVNDGTFVYGNTQTINKTGEVDISLAGISSTIFSTIFSGRTELKVLVVANATTPDGTSTTTMDDIKATAVTLSGFGKQDSFVMAGEGTLTKTGASTAATDEIGLKRLASKLTLHLIVPDTYVDGAAKVWLPQMDAVQIDLYHLGKNILVNGEDDSHPTLGDVTRKSTSSDFVMEDVFDETLIPTVHIAQDLSLKAPVYSYPREWDNGDESTPYLYVTLPWEMEDGTVAADTYYKILIPGTSLESNVWYDITARLGGLGSLVKEGTTTVEDLSINIAKDWKDAIGEGKNNTDADMAMPRVIALEQNIYTIYNQNSIEIPFVSSHDCNIVEASTSEINSKGLPANQDSGAGTASSISLDNASRVITFTHVLKDMPATGKTYDYKEYIHTYKLVHKTDASMYEYITIVQKPALCVSTEVFKTSSPDKAKNTIFVDGVSYQSTSDTYRVLGTSKEEGTLTRVTASVLPQEGIIGSFILGDVRSKTNCMGTAPFIYPDGTVKVRTSSTTEKFRNTEANGRRLTYYYKASEDAGNMIAPEFIIASSLPGVSGHYMNYEQAQLRCATFQEEGYPAGRWRLPTYAEMRFIFRLQLDGKIGTVFDADNTYNIDNITGKHYSPYACANGNFYRANDSKTEIEQATGSSSSAIITGSVRCVYDSWYWDNTDNPRLPKASWTTFTWGDEEITW